MVVFFSVPFIYAQSDFVSIKGKVKNSKDKSDVVFANVSIEGTSISTVTNIDGEFLIKVKKSLNAKKLVFAHVGYNSKTLNISELKPNKNVVYLEPSGILIKEIKVRPENARDLVLKAFRNTNKNYSNRALNAEGFYRETVKKRRDYLTIAEALVDIYKSSYTKTLDNDRVKIYKGRKSTNVKHADTLAIKMRGGPRISLMFDVIKNPHLLMENNSFDNYNFKIEGVKTVDKKLVYEILFYPANKQSDYALLKGKLFIDVEALAVVSIECSVDLSDIEKACKVFVKKKPAGVKITPVKTKYIINYKQINGLYFFNYTRSELKFRCNWKKKLFNSHYSVMAELAITDWHTDKAEKIKYKESFKQDDIFEEEVSAFIDKDFWGEHNTIEPDKSIETAIKKYKRQLKRRNSK